jgi:outer membrane protein assembly factor BamB
VWKFPFGGDVVGIAATNDLVFVAALDNVVRALNRSNGNQIWKRPLTTRPVAAPQVFDGVIAVPAADSVATFNSKTGVPIGTFDATTLLRGQPLVDATPKPFAVSILAITRDGLAIGLRPIEMLFRDAAIEPLAALPGHAVQREASPLQKEATSLP